MFFASLFLALAAPLLDSLTALAANTLKYAGLILVGVVCSLILWHGTATGLKVVAVVLAIDNLLVYLAFRGEITLPSPRLPAVKSVAPAPVKPAEPKKV